MMAMQCCVTRRSRGFTLIEAMVVLAIIGIIAAIAIPSYSKSVVKSKRQLGKAEIMEILSRQEQYFVNNKTYALTLAALGYAGDPYFIDQDGNSSAAVTGNSIYQISLVGPSATAFTIQAAPQNGQASDTQCGSLQLSSTGQKAIVGGSDTASNCW